MKSGLSSALIAVFINQLIKRGTSVMVIRKHDAVVIMRKHNFRAKITIGEIRAAHQL